MINILGTILVALAAFTGATLGFQDGPAFGAFSDPLISLAVGTSPTNGYVLQTDGTDSTWVATSSLGITGGTGATVFGDLTDVATSTDATGDIYYLNSSGQIVNLGIGGTDEVLKVSGGLPSWGTDATGGGGADPEFDYGTNIFGQTSAATSSALEINSTGTSTFAGGLEAWRQIAAPYFHATSTATSTFAGDINLSDVDGHIRLHGLEANGSSGLHIHSNNGTQVAYFGAGGGTGVTLSGYTSALLQTGATGAVAEYAGTSCTNQFVRALSALGIATCETVDVSADTNLAVTWPITISNDTLGWGGLATTSQPTAGQLLYSDGINGLIPVSTSSINVGTATALEANGANCSAGSYALGVDASGAAEGCTDATTEIDSAISTHAGNATAHQALVTLAGALDYLTLSGQEITRNAIDLATDVTNTLGITNGGTGTSTPAVGGQILAWVGSNWQGVATTTFSTGLTYSNGDVTVNTSQNIDTLSNLTGNGFVKTSGGTGALSIDTNTYLTGNETITLSGDVSGSGTTAITTTLGLEKVLGRHLSTTTTFLDGEILKYVAATDNFTSVTCAEITGSADLCDGNDASGVGGTGLATTSPIADSNVLTYSASGAGSAYGTATSSITAGTGLSYSGTLGALVGGTNGSLTVNTSQNITTLSNLTGNGAILTSGGVGTLGTYTGTSCTNQFVRSLNGSIVATCETVANTDLANSTISGISLGSNLADLTATDTTLTFSGAYNGGTARTVGLNLANANDWTALQTFTNASSSLLSVTNTAYFGGTATSTFDSAGVLTLVGNLVFDGTTLTGTSGLDTTLISGTATNGECAQFNGDGDIVGAGAACGSGGGAAPIATSTNETAGRVPYWTSTSGTPATLGEVATTTITGGTGLTFSGTPGFLLGGSNTTLSVDASQTQITEIGTITTGVWNGTTIAVANGGTGATTLDDIVGTANQLTVTNGASTIIGGDVTLSIPALFDIQQASTTQFSAGIANFGLTATSTFDGIGSLTLPAGASLTVTDLTSALTLTGAGGTFAEYTGTSCTNQFVRSLSALGVATCESVANTDLVNSSVSYGGVSVALGASDATPAFNLADATAYPGDSSLVTTGALNSGSLTSGFGNIDIGSSNFDADGVITSLGTIDFGGATSLEIPNNGTVNANGEITTDDTSGQLRFYAGGAERVIAPTQRLGFAYATTSWTGTTTLNIGPAYLASSVDYLYCETNTGTVAVSLYDGSNRANFVPTASTTINKFNYTTNNTFTAGESMRVDLGQPVSSPTRISCSFGYTVTAD